MRNRSVYSSFISIFTWLMNVYKTNSSVSSPLFSFILCTEKYFLLEYFFCQSIFVSKFSKWLRGVDNCPRKPLITSSFSPLSSSYFSNLFLIMSTASVRSFSCQAPLTCLLWYHLEISVNLVSKFLNPNLVGLFRGSFWGRGWAVKLVPLLSKTY